MGEFVMVFIEGSYRVIWVRGFVGYLEVGILKCRFYDYLGTVRLID